MTCEVTPHHLALTDAAVAGYDTHAKMNPPLRDESDRLALLAAIADGTVDAIATDHAPHNADEKCVEFSQAPFGVVGLETAVSICLDRLVHGGIIGLPRLVELLSSGPAFGLAAEEGIAAGGRRRRHHGASTSSAGSSSTPAAFESKSVNTPFGGWTLRGGPVMTIVGGRIVHDAR